MLQHVSKSQLKPLLLEYLRQVEKTKEPLIVTHAGNPVAKIISYSETSIDVLSDLRGTVIKFNDPTKPLQIKWEASNK